MAFRLSPYERFVLSFCQGTGDRLFVFKAAKRELDSPGVVKNMRIGLVGLFCFTFLVGIKRQPFLFVIGPFVAAGCYLALLYQLLLKIF